MLGGGEYSKVANQFLSLHTGIAHFNVCTMPGYDRDEVFPKFCFQNYFKYLPPFAVAKIIGESFYSLRRQGSKRSSRTGNRKARLVKQALDDTGVFPTKKNRFQLCRRSRCSEKGRMQTRNCDRVSGIAQANDLNAQMN